MALCLCCCPDPAFFFLYDHRHEAEGPAEDPKNVVLRAWFTFALFWLLCEHWHWTHNPQRLVHVEQSATAVLIEKQSVTTTFPKSFFFLSFP